MYVVAVGGRRTDAVREEEAVDLRVPALVFEVRSEHVGRLGLRERLGEPVRALALLREIFRKINQIEETIPIPHRRMG